MFRCLALLLISAGCFLLPGSVSAQTRLSWKFAEKEQFFVEWKGLTIMRSRSGLQIGESMVEVQSVSRFKVIRNDADGMVLEQQIGSVQTRSDGPAAVTGFDAFKGLVLRLIVEAGRLKQIEGLESIVGPKQGDEYLPHQKTQLEFLECMVRLWYAGMFPGLPNDKVQPGVGWTEKLGRAGSSRIEQDRICTYVGEETWADNKLHRIDVNVKNRPWTEDKAAREFSLETTRERSEGAMYYDADWGRVVRYDCTTEMRVEAKTPPVIRGKPQALFDECTMIASVRMTKEDPREKPDGEVKPLQAKAKKSVDLGKTWTNSLGMQLVRIEPGKFSMGSRTFGRPDTEKPREVEITRPFYMGAHEVTIGQFRKFVEETKYQTEAERNPRGCFGWNKTTGKLESSAKYSWHNPGWDCDDRHPAVNLTWEDAKCFCQWLGKKDGKAYRLPTEAEWEYACRAGTTTEYHGGDEPECLAKIGNVVDVSAKKLFPQWQSHSEDDGYAFTAPVGSFQPNAFGLYDMHGNALEWCEDWFFAYPSEKGIDPKGPPAGIRRVQRGGGFPDFPHQSTSSRRAAMAQDSYCVSSGFRVVLGESAPFERRETWVGKTVMPRDPQQCHWVSRQNPVPYLVPVMKVTMEKMGLVRTLTQGRDSVEDKTELLPLAEALERYNEILKEQADVRGLFVRSCAHKAMGNTVAALHDLSAAIELDPRDPWLHLERAKLHTEAGDHAQALVDLESALKLREDTPWTCVALAYFLATCPEADLRDGTRAVELALQAQKLIPYNLSILDTLAAAYAESGDFEKASRLQQQVIDELGKFGVTSEDHRNRLETYRRKEAHREGK